jgi:hypothetical protein
MQLRLLRTRGRIFVCGIRWLGWLRTAPRIVDRESVWTACLTCNLDWTILTQRSKFHARTAACALALAQRLPTRTSYTHFEYVRETESDITSSLLFKLEETPSQRHCCTPSRSQATPCVREHDHDNRLLHKTLSDLSPVASADPKICNG